MNESLTGRSSTGKILITGGCGFIGSNLAAHYLEKGWEVVVYDNFSRLGAESNAAWLADRADGRLDFEIADIRNFASLCKAVMGADVVAHLAAQVAVTHSVVDPREDFEINALGGFNLLEAVRACGADPVVIYASTNKVYGELNGAQFHEMEQRYEYEEHEYGIAENFPIDLHSPYGCSKGALDLYMLDYARIYGLKTVVFRQSCIYGPRQFGVEDQGWVAHFIISALLGRPITIYGDGKQVRDILHVRDLITAFEAAIEHIDVSRGQAYNIGGGSHNTLSLLELIDRLRAKVDRPITLEFDDWRPGDQKVYVSDIRKAKGDLGWEPLIGVGVGLSDLRQWVQSNRELFEHADLAEMLPEPSSDETLPTRPLREGPATPLPSLTAAEAKARRVRAITGPLKEPVE
ncbi:MAG: NAD-dependent epimerase/dehydratase family protein [Anaerolineales bacterium]